MTANSLEKTAWIQFLVKRIVEIFISEFLLESYLSSVVPLCGFISCSGRMSGVERLASIHP